MKKFGWVMFFIFCFPVAMIVGLFKLFIGIANEQEKRRKRNSRHRGVMCGPGGSKRR